MIRTTLLSLTLMAVLVAATPSDFVDREFHFALSKSTPTADSSVDSPTEIRLWFTEAPEAKMTSIRLIGADGEPIHTADVTQDEADERSFGVAIEHALSSGTYTVAWRAIVADGHVVRDDYQFTVVAK